MKIEKLSDTQLRFTLWKNDLDEADVKISDLAGARSGKADELLRNIMQRAREELDFDVEGASIMVEAMQVDQECIVFLVTKVDGEEQLDPKYEYVKKLQEAIKTDPDSLREKFGDVFVDRTRGNEEKYVENGSQKEQGSGSEPEKRKIPSYVLYSFSDLENVIKVAKMTSTFYDSDNSLYKTPDENKYYLMVTRNRNSEDEFNVAVKCLREFGVVCTINYGTKFFVEEHYDCIIKDNALQMLSEM